MKMVKSLLLGSAAGLVAIAGAQAADLPVKAKPVQYVRICTLYGDGFYYIPGTDTCIKIGGYVRAEWNYQAGGSFKLIADTEDWDNSIGINTPGQSGDPAPPCRPSPLPEFAAMRRLRRSRPTPPNWAGVRR